MSRVAKVTISVPTEMLEAFERERERHADEEYIRGYQEFPESEDKELQAWVQGGMEALAHLYRDEEPWPEAQLEADKP